MTVNTTYTNPSTLDKAVGAVLPAADVNKILSNQYHIAGTAGHIGARAYNSANISIPDNTMTTITLNAEHYDTDPNGEIHSTSANTERMTVRTAGKYLVVGSIRFAPNATGYRQARLITGGGDIIAEWILPAATAAIDVSWSVSAIYEFTASSYVYMQAYQNSGGALNVVAASASSPTLMIAKV